jgi:hypothetical protein
MPLDVEHVNIDHNKKMQTSIKKTFFQHEQTEPTNS